MLLLIGIPYLAYSKLLNRTVTEQGSYLLALTKNGGETQKSSDKVSNWLIFFMVLLGTPLAIPVAYVFGVGYLLYLTCHPAMGKKADDQQQ